MNLSFSSIPSHSSSTSSSQDEDQPLPPSRHQLSSPTPVEEVSEISRLRHQLNERSLQLMESRHNSERSLQDMTANMQKQLVELASTKSQLRRFKRARPLHRDNQHRAAAPHSNSAMNNNNLLHQSRSPSIITTSSASSTTTASHLAKYARGGHGSTSSSSSARTQWPHEHELHQLRKKYRHLQSSHRALEATVGKQNLQQMEHQDQCEVLQARVLAAEEARNKMKRSVLRLQQQSHVLGNDLASRVSLVESKSIEYRRRLQDAETKDQQQEDEIRQLQHELTLVSAREDVLKRRVADALSANEQGRDAVIKVDRLRRRVNELNVKLERKENVMEQQAKRAQTAVEFQNALVACKGRLAQREEQLTKLRTHLHDARAQTRTVIEQCAKSKEEIAVTEASKRAEKRITFDLRRKLEEAREENETLRHHHAGQQEHIYQLQADLASVSSLGMEEATLFSSGGPSMNQHRNHNRNEKTNFNNQQQAKVTVEEKVNMTLQRKLDETEHELAKMKQMIDGVIPPTMTSMTTAGTEIGGGVGLGGSGLLRSLLLDVEIMTEEVLTMSSLLMKLIEGKNDLIGPDDLLVDRDVLLEREGRGRGESVVLPPIAKLCTRVVHVRKEVRVVRQHLADRLADSLDGRVDCGMQ